jgi:ribosomal protein S27E
MDFENHFSRLADRLNKFFEQADRPRKSFHQIVFCRNCRQLQLIYMKDECSCPACQSDLVIQS